MFIKKAAAVSLSLIIAASLFGCGRSNTGKAKNGKLPVTVTFNAMKEFTEAVGKDKVSITTIIPDGTEPHDFEPKPKDLIAISDAKVFVYNGMGMEVWADSAVAAAKNATLVAVDASNGVTPIKDTGEKGSAVQDDPHVFISLKSAETEAKNIKNAISKADPKNSAYYEKNCDAFVAKLETLFNEYKKKFESIKRKDFVTGHAAFAYLCRDFDLSQESVEDVFADGEPSAQKLNELIEYCKKNDVKTVFVEDMVSPAVSKTLASSVGAKVKTIYTIESSEDGKSYLQRINDDLHEIFDSLSQ